MAASAEHSQILLWASDNGLILPGGTDGKGALADRAVSTMGGDLVTGPVPTEGGMPNIAMRPGVGNVLLPSTDSTFYPVKLGSGASDVLGEQGVPWQAALNEFGTPNAQGGWTFSGSQEQLGGAPVNWGTTSGASKGAAGDVSTTATGTTSTGSGSTPMISGVTVVDQRTGAVYQGTVDLQPTLDRIANGGAPLSRNDGTVFQNRPVNGVQLLPVKPSGYYKEYVVPTPGISGPGPQRVIIGQGGEVYYTSDHYQSFVPVKN